ncbi:prephenate dehydrogenase/arogenate dehydrogenase family protein [Paractinoplanes lichenicola]|uniref:Prephenate dehydrogenase/arogenate dehydrogenase family protein n=1 Tax=Paractinoplanes lichenicola TaxID=2802976 RepID=A0ABS1W565_9ACTN|nr:prephenate dehydrogenase/arogenate dehydrogenase family protein [Actinoplanes lichenicola]MBL7261837.1 prephenate dehydrogenase/arogenate dehydrogenase family protein [Actinoplanes lichenicola]
MNIAIVGLGLIGGSLLRALSAGGHRVVGYDADPATRELAAAAGFEVAASVAQAIAGIEGAGASDTRLVVLAVPLPALGEVFEQLAGFEGLVTDVTSVKAPVRELAVKHGVKRFVGGHPMAGKETSGFAATEATLFEGCSWVLTVEPAAELEDWVALAALYTELGARVVPVTASEHDRAVAEVSHVPHLFAAALALQLRDNPLAGALAAGSFRDGTRVAATRAELIVAMCGGNATEVDGALGRLIGELEQMRRDLGREPVRDLTPTVARAGELRRAWPAPPGEPAEMAATVTGLLELGRAGGWVTEVTGNRIAAMRPESGRNSS